MKTIDLILQIVFAVMLFYATYVILKRERTLRQPVKYMVSYFRQGANGVSYGSIGVDVRGGIKDKNLHEVVELVRSKTGVPDAFVMGFSRYED